MVKTTCPLVFIFLAVFASMCHQTFSHRLTIPTRREQCRRLGYAGACDFTEWSGSAKYSCANLTCAQDIGPGISGERQYIKRYLEQPVIGTYCGPSSYCCNGECLPSTDVRMFRYKAPEISTPGCFD